MSYSISGGHQKTVEGAEIILQQGGNAVDAAIAAYLVSFISEPCMASMGSGGFALINDNKAVHCVDFFCQTPKHKLPVKAQEFFPITVDFGKTTEDFYVGKGSIAMPGAVAGIFEMHRRWGSMPIKDIFEPAILWSKDGIQVDSFQAYDFSLLKDILCLSEENKHIFYHENGTLKKEGDIVQMPQLSDLLYVMAREGRDLFYKGEIAKSVSQDLEGYGHLSMEDFENYKVSISTPLEFSFLNKKIHTPGFPSVGGMLITALLNTFQDAVESEHIQFLSIEHFQFLVNTFREIQKLKNEPQKVSRYLMENFGINAPFSINNNSHKWGGTSHFNVIDSQGITVSLTTSIGEGAGYFIKGTDMQMNNMLGEEALMPDGFHNWQRNVRLQSMMSPTIITNTQGKTITSIGSGGAGRIPYAISQALINLLYFNKNISDAVLAPRVHLYGDSVECEEGFMIDSSLIPNVNVWEKRSLFFGGTHSIQKERNAFFGLADSRRNGASISK